MSGTSPEPGALEAYLRHFAAGAFFEAHEDLEGPWRERDGDPFLQGLILFAAAHVKLQRGGAAGAARHFRSALRYLQPYAPAYAGLDVAAVCRHAHLAAAALAPYVAPGAPPLPAEALGAVVPRFCFRRCGDLRLPPPPAVRPLDAAGLQRAIAAALAARRAAGEPVGPASWAAVAKEVARRTGGRVPRQDLRAAVRRALGETGP
jgi:hypothetical protein